MLDDAYRCCPDGSVDVKSLGDGAKIDFLDRMYRYNCIKGEEI